MERRGGTMNLPFMIRRKNGYTIIELMLVVFMISVLATIGVGRVGKSLASARDKRRKTELRELQHMIELYRIDHGYYPPDIWGCDTSMGLSLETPCINPFITPPEWQPGGLLEIQLQGYFRRLPKDPLNRIPFMYFFEPVYSQNQFGINCGVDPCAYILSTRLENDKDKEADPGCNGCNAPDNFCIYGGGAKSHSNC